MSISCLSYRLQTLNEIESDRIIFEDSKVRSIASDLLALEEIAEVVVLSTCLRTEIYAILDKFHVGLESIYKILSKYSGLDEEIISRVGTVFIDEQAVMHLFNVASGLDSIVVGEGEILGQVKSAYSIGQGIRTVGPQLNLLFKHALEVGKQVRQDTKLSSGITSMAHASAAIAASHVGDDFNLMSIGVLGAGQMAATVLKALKQRHGINDITIINRTEAKGNELAKEFSVKFAPLNNLQSVISDLDVLFVATAASQLIVTEKMLKSAMEIKTSPLVVSDLSVPRNVEPEVAYVKGVTLFDINDITRFVEKNKESKQFAVRQAQEIVNERLVKYKEALKFKGVDSLVAEIVSRIDLVKDDFIDKRLKDKESFTRNEVEILLSQISASIAHLPVSRLKQNLRESKDQKVFEAVRYLFDIEDF